MQLIDRIGRRLKLQDLHVLMTGGLARLRGSGGNQRQPRPDRHDRQVTAVQVLPRGRERERNGMRRSEQAYGHEEE